jgi:signal transduction histidine kinase
LDIDSTLGIVHLDPMRLKQVLYNYLSNAIKFTPEGGRVTLRVRPDGSERFRIEVEDTGIGIRPEDEHRLFIEFQQLDAGTAKKFSGSGLGLALTKRLVEAQGGTVGVRSVFGAGSTFFATLPRHVTAETADITAPVTAWVR